ncbi:orotidine 5'-phosphate decarboxylase [Tepiditoga spiralis]|uniref:Orotidine-5'-phosphate decarboxylase n=1 Tax=Tepiditoga spiralis TaxID=2108365 RepID=A0A7G1GAA7_9BACT|nr:orotidine-5'-phosphate decarboxylase [Tepiditoga spiralis]BBE32017.1 orotidine 5'-phosphate decarboxylase [Tepiditoga spiralis]
MFYEKYLKMREKNNSVLIVGLDSDTNKFNSKFSKDAIGIFEFNKYIIEQTNEYVCGYKPNIAFYEKHGYKGIQALEKTVEYIKKYTELPIIIDAKRGDIGNTAAAYAEAFFKYLKVDSITINPYMGMETINPYIELENSHVFVLGLTSNKGAKDFELENDLYLKVIKNVNEYNKKFKDKIGIVVGATNDEHIEKITKNSGNMVYLIPGIGAQGGSIEKLFKGLNGYKNIVINSSRGIIFSEDPKKSAKELKENLNKARGL